MDTCLTTLTQTIPITQGTILPYPLVSKLTAFRKFRKSLSEFFHRLIQASAESGALYEADFIPTLSTWVIAMSSAQLRSFRHTATVVALEVESALALVAVDVDKESETVGRQREGEKKRKGKGAGGGRDKDLEKKAAEIKERRDQLMEYLQEFFDG
jgi:cohesin complex subunit SA-1/2